MTDDFAFPAEVELTSGETRLLMLLANGIALGYPPIRQVAEVVREAQCVSLGEMFHLFDLRFIDAFRIGTDEPVGLTGPYSHLMIELKATGRGQRAALRPGLRLLAELCRVDSRTVILSALAANSASTPRDIETAVRRDFMRLYRSQDGKRLDEQHASNVGDWPRISAQMTERGAMWTPVGGLTGGTVRLVRGFTALRSVL